MTIQEIEERLQDHSLTRIYADQQRNAAILLPLTGKPENPALLFEVRNRKLTQGGEICFPGGRINEGETALEAALRETAEELAFPAERIRDIHPLHVSRGPGGVEVTSFLGRLEDYAGTFSREEVDHVFAIPVEELLSLVPEIHEMCLEVRTPDDFPYDKVPLGKNYPWRKEPGKVYFYQTSFGIIWGMTARFLYYFLETLR